jgi:hypothetical protein
MVLFLLEIFDSLTQESGGIRVWLRTFDLLFLQIGQAIPCDIQF